MQIKQEMTMLSAEKIAEVNEIISRMDNEVRENDDLPVEVALTFIFTPAEEKLVVKMNNYLEEEITL